MNNWLFLALGVFLGSATGFITAALFASNKIQEAWNKGFERGKSISVNLIK